MGTKEELLRILEMNEGKFISGAEIADMLGVSGTAVWKAVRKLIAEGCDIEAVTNKGYRLVAEPDVLSAAGIQRYYRELSAAHGHNVSGKVLISGASTAIDEQTGLAMPRTPLKIEVFDSVDSTNNMCQARAATGEPEVYVAIAGNQTAGRGRRGRTFYSPDGTGLYMSILLRPSGLSAEESLAFTTMAATSVAQSIETVTGKAAVIKWVNDVYMNSRKVCGILTEGSFNLESGDLDYAIVGIGINVREPDGGFPEEIRDIAGAVISGSESMSRNKLAAAVLWYFMNYYRTMASGTGTEFPVNGTDTYQHARDGSPNSDCNTVSTDAVRSDVPPVSYVDEYIKRCFVVGREIMVIRPGVENRAAVATGLDRSLRLHVRYDDGTEEDLSSGEISIRL